MQRRVHFVCPQACVLPSRLIEPNKKLKKAS